MLIESFELAVIGAGPAGLEAALTASQAGVQTVLIDNSSAPGGQYFQKPPAAFHPRRLTAIEQEGEVLIQRANATQVCQMYNALVWGIFHEDEEGWQVELNVSGAPRKIRARCLILAPGAYDTPLAFPGWTLPGVITSGAALLLLKNQRLAPFRRVLVSGSGPLLLSTAAHLVEAGVEVVRVCESNRMSARALAYAPTLLREWRRLAEGLQYGAALLRSRTPYRLGWSVVAARGQERVEEASIARLDAQGFPVAGTQETFAVDAVICGYGLTPNTGLARMIGCQFDYHPDQRAWLPWRDENLCTSLPGVYLAGDGAGIGGAANSRLEGRIAASAAALATGHIDRQAAQAFSRQMKPQLDQQRRFGRFLAECFTPPAGLSALAQDDTLVCRCEEITLAEVKAAVAAGARTIGEVKMLTRAGMGNCQGRMCEPSISAAILTALVQESPTPAAIGMYSVRPPLHPLPVGFFAKNRDET